MVLAIHSEHVRRTAGRSRARPCQTGGTMRYPDPFAPSEKWQPYELVPDECFAPVDSQSVDLNTFLLASEEGIEIDRLTVYWREALIWHQFIRLPFFRWGERVWIPHSSASLARACARTSSRSPDVLRMDCQYHRRPPT